MHSGFTGRTIVRTDRYRDEAAELQPDMRRLDEAEEYLDFRLSEAPDSGIPSSVPGIWVAPVRVPSDTGILRASVFYTFTDTHVYYQSIQRRL